MKLVVNYQAYHLHSGKKKALRGIPFEQLHPPIQWEPIKITINQLTLKSIQCMPRMRGKMMHGTRP